MARPVDIGFDTPFAEQVAFFRQKKALGTLHWDDLTHAEHDRAFVVAGAMKADLLADLHAAVQKGIEKGSGLDTFRKDFKAAVEKHDWHGWTGEGADAGEAWRTKIIFETNLRSSYAAGRHAQLTDPDLLKRRPYWRYIHSASVLHPRPDHLAWNGLTLPHDHEFWQTHFPPNGWGCCCRVTSARAPGEGDLTTPPAGWNAVSAKTGAPPGIDKGWAYAPGASVAEELRNIVEQKAASLPEQLAAQVIGTGMETKAFQEWFDNPSGSWPMVRVPNEDALKIGAKPGVTVGNLSGETAAKQKREHPELDASEYKKAQTVIDQHTNKAQDGPNNMIYVRETDSNNGGYVLVVKATRTGEALWVTSYRRLSRRDAKMDSEVSRLLKKGQK